MLVNLIKVQGKKAKKDKDGNEYIPSYIALQLNSGKLIFIKPFDNSDYNLLKVLADKK